MVAASFPTRAVLPVVGGTLGALAGANTKATPRPFPPAEIHVATDQFPDPPLLPVVGGTLRHWRVRMPSPQW
ncbi:hypothetical protein ACQP2U_30890 [Nocardia sp. CA-084685]|uniref:hypothetical protein n=1 Tax=Nocardia sp. CA-084685 TaxID=3239970 RepID=UPI003D9A04BE